MFLYKIGPNEEKQRLDKYLKKLLKGAPDSFIYRMLRKKNITLNGKKCDGKEMLHVKDEVKLFFSDETFEKFTGQRVVAAASHAKEAAVVENTVSRVETEAYQKAYHTLKKCNIVYEDTNVLVVNKPVGILSQKAMPKDFSLNEWLIGYLLCKQEIQPQTLSTFKPSICNRLDRNTSGMVVCGKTLAGSQYMSSIIKDKTLEKFYYCVVAGNVEINKRMTGYLYKSNKMNKVSIYSQKEEIPVDCQGSAEFIDTAFHTVEAKPHATMLEVQLFTGKTHQIRAHLASIGHPLIGDAKYGDHALNQAYKKMGVTSQLLHACRLVFPKASQESFKDLSGMTLICREPELFHRVLECEDMISQDRHK